MQEAIRRARRSLLSEKWVLPGGRIDRTELGVTPACALATPVAACLGANLQFSANLEGPVPGPLFHRVRSPAG